MSRIAAWSVHSGCSWRLVSLGLRRRCCTRTRPTETMMPLPLWKNTVPAVQSLRQPAEDLERIHTISPSHRLRVYTSPNHNSDEQEVPGPHRSCRALAEPLQQPYSQGVTAPDATQKRAPTARHPRLHSAHHWLYTTGHARHPRSSPIIPGRKAYQLIHLHRQDTLPRQTSAKPQRSQYGLRRRRIRSHAFHRAPCDASRSSE